MALRRASRRRRATLLALGLASLAAVGLVAVRWLATGALEYRWLAYDLLLAWIPFLLALALYDGTRGGWSARRRWLVGVLWLLFLPNAPYLATEFIHLGAHPEAPAWFDGVMIGSFGVTGVMLGFLSLSLVQHVLADRVGARLAWAFALGTLALTSVGIYLGRVDRFNSWDALANPAPLLGTLRDRVATPLDDLHFAGLVLAMARGLVVAYAALHGLGWLRGPIDGESRQPDG